MRVHVARISGLYYEPEVEMHHFVFLCHREADAQVPGPDGSEIAECRYWSLDALPRPINDFTIRRIREALQGDPVTLIMKVPPRQWFD